MRRDARPSLNNPVLEVLYRRIRDLEESLPRVGLARSAGQADRDAPQRVAATPRRSGAQAGATCPDPPRPAGPFEYRPRELARTLAKTGA